MGFIPDCIAGAYRKLRGEKVTFNSPLPQLTDAELKALKGMNAVANVNSHGQVFEDDLHLLSHITFACATKYASPVIEQFDFLSLCEPPFDAMKNSSTFMPSRRFDLIGISIVLPEVSDMLPRIPASCLIWLMLPRAPDWDIM